MAANDLSAWAAAGPTAAREVAVPLLPSLCTNRTTNFNELLSSRRWR